MRWTDAVGMNPPGWILRGSDGLGNRPLGFMAFGSEAAEQFQLDVEALWAKAMSGSFGPYKEGILPEGWAKAWSDLVDSYLPEPY
jgi:hypothetical protein